MSVTLPPPPAARRPAVKRLCEILFSQSRGDLTKPNRRRRAGFSSHGRLGLNVSRSSMEGIAGGVADVIYTEEVSQPPPLAKTSGFWIFFGAVTYIWISALGGRVPPPPSTSHVATSPIFLRLSLSPSYTAVTPIRAEP